MDGSGVPGTKSLSSLVSENCPGQERCGSDGGYAVSKDLSYTLQEICQARYEFNSKFATVEARGGHRMQ